MTGTYANRHPFDRLIGALYMHGGHRGGQRHGRHRGHRGGWGDFPFGPGFGGPPNARKARRGDVRAAALVLLDEEPRNGYQLMQEIERRSDGAWRPSPGSVYPAMQQLEDEGLVRTTELDGRRVFELTDEGRKHVEEKREDLGAPWEAFSSDVSDESWDMIGLMKDVGFAAVQVLRAGNEAQTEQARTVLTDTKRALYRILADEDADADADADADKA